MIEALTSTMPHCRYCWIFAARPYSDPASMTLAESCETNRSVLQMGFPCPYLLRRMDPSSSHHLQSRCRPYSPSLPQTGYLCWTLQMCLTTERRLRDRGDHAIHVPVVKDEPRIPHSHAPVSCDEAHTFRSCSLSGTDSCP